MTEQVSGTFKSAGGFLFGVENWSWGTPVPRTITFFLDGTAVVSDQWGRPMKGVVADGKKVLFAPTPPEANADHRVEPRKEYATHAEVVAALAAENIDWRTLTWAGWPQLPYEQLKELGAVPHTPASALATIPDPALRKAALRLRAEVDDARQQELAARYEPDPAPDAGTATSATK